MYDIVFISYNEPLAEENWKALKARFPRAKRVNGVKGIVAAHQAAAKKCMTKFFWTVDADNIVNDDFDFSFTWSNDVQSNRVAVWRTKISVNDLEYGYGGIKLLPRRAVLAVDPDKVVDFTTSIAAGNFWVIDQIASTTVIDSTPFEAWKSAFRECTKLASKVITGTVTEETDHRLHEWMTHAVGPYADDVLRGAAAGCELGLSGNTDMIKNINDFDWLRAQFESDEPFTVEAKSYPVAIDHVDYDSSRVIEVGITLGNTCTYACSYCPENLHSGTYAWMPIQELKAFMCSLVDHYADRQVVVEYTGGEPTVYPDFSELVEASCKLGIKQSIITNASRSVRWWEKHKNTFDKVHITYHHEFAKMDHIVDVIKAICDTTRVHVNLPVIPEEFAEIYDNAVKLSGFDNTIVALKPLRVGFGDELYPYTESQLALIREFRSKPKFTTTSIYDTRGIMRKQYSDGKSEMKAPSRFVADGDNQWQGWQCQAGLQTLFVAPSGDIYRGTCKAGGRVGNVVDGYILPTTDITCPFARCSCPADIMAEKRKA